MNGAYATHFLQMVQLMVIEAEIWMAAFAAHILQIIQKKEMMRAKNPTARVQSISPK